MSLSLLAIQKALQCQWHEAINLNEQILEEEPQNIDALNRLAQAHLSIGELAKAKSCYLKVLQQDKYNPIAKRNLMKLRSLQPQNGHGEMIITQARPFNFIEEPGKTKVVSLVQLGERAILSKLQPSVNLDIVIRSQSVCLYYAKQYVGRLPDDIGKRLIWLCRRNNEYLVCIKSVEKNRLVVFIREAKRSSQNRNICSFQILERQAFEMSEMPSL